MNHKCRTCLSSEDDMESIFIDLLINSKFMPIPNIIYLCTGVQISKRDPFSSVICRNCIHAIVVAYKYRIKCWESQMMFLGMAKKRETAVEINEIELRTSVNDQTDTEIVQITTPINFVQSMVETKPPETEHFHRKLSTIEKAMVPKVYRDMLKYIRISDELNCARPFICVQCDTAYIELQSLRKHLTYRHSVLFKTSFRCHICSKYFAHKTLLGVHVRRHKETGIKNICHHCGKNFNSEATLKIHLRRHSGYKPFKCNECPYRSVSSTDLAIHTRSHTGEKPFKCHVCDRAFKTTSHRAIHIRNNHSDERPYKCVICPKTFKSGSAHKLHMARHNPTKAVECPECKKLFKERKSLSVHMKGHRPPKCKCPVCERKFTHMHNLKVHIRTVHKNEKQSN